jgi:hypothetical protein
MGISQIAHVKGDDNLADIFTKVLRYNLVYNVTPMYHLVFQASSVSYEAIGNGPNRFMETVKCQC